MPLVTVDPFPSSFPAHLGLGFTWSASLLQGICPPMAACEAEAAEAASIFRPTALTCTFLFRLTAGKNRPSTFSNAMGPCCSSLIKNVKVFLFKSRRTPIVAPFVIPPSVLWEKKTIGFHLAVIILEEAPFLYSETNVSQPV